MFVGLCAGHILNVRLGAAFQAWKIFTSLQQDYKDRVTVGRIPFVQETNDLAVAKVGWLTCQVCMLPCGTEHLSTITLPIGLQAAACHWGNITLGRALRTWRANVILAAQLKNLLKRWEASKAYGAFEAWREWQINRLVGRSDTVVRTLQPLLLLQSDLSHIWRSMTWSMCNPVRSVLPTG